MKRYAPPLLALTLSIVLGSCERAPQLDYEVNQVATYQHAAIAGPHPKATEVGEAILRRGGNAIDAAVAVNFAMAVVYPRAGNIGGGGFLVYRDNTGGIDALDYRERAPAAADRDMYLDENEEVVPGLSTRGHLAVGVPGTVAGMAKMHDKYGSLPWVDLIEPAILLARDGYRLSQSEVDRIKRYHDDFAELNEPNMAFLDTTAVEGSLLQQPELAATLQRIRDNGRDGFYGGETAKLIAEEMGRGGGLITTQDLADYQATWRTPITKDYRNYRVISMPPSSSGGVCLAQMLEMLEPHDLGQYGFQSPEATQLTVEAMRRAYADRAEYLGDMDYYRVPLDSLLNDDYLAYRMSDFEMGVAGTSDSILAGALTKETFETTHISIVDSLGNAVAITTTLNGNFGSKVVVDGGGFFLNNEMDDFSAKPGVPNMFGLVGNEANAIQPGKRMLSSMTPTIVEKDGELFLVLGAPGGSTIITAVLQTFLNVVEFNMDLPEAVAASRFHHQWLPDQILHEEAALPAETREALGEMGYDFRQIKYMAKIKAIQVEEDGSLQAVGDPRNGDDDVAGF